MPKPTNEFALRSVFKDKEGFALVDWVLFEKGTFVVMTRKNVPKDDVINEAKRILKEYGEVFPGSSSGDFKVNKFGKLNDKTGHHLYLVFYDTEEDDGPLFGTVVIEEKEKSDVSVGLFGRGRREEDYNNPVVVSSSLD